MRGLICDDHPLMRQAMLATLKARWPGTALDEADSYPAAWHQARSGPDFCVVDLAMPGAAPLEGISRLKAAAPDAVLLVITGLTDEALLQSIAACGVAALLPKTLESSAMLDAVERIVPGLSATAAPTLAPRQREVLGLMGAGLSNKEIALRLGLSPATVKIHVARVIENLAAANRTDAVSRAQRAGMI
ncbi:response regulator transcription factor [Sphingomonas tabacisoli]|uniref:Response regulator transcription factor n=1 Tax=Sphingomonas tabacisoli TaxID=2249466 RepID=A0ABW4I1L9_9SPHN